MSSAQQLTNGTRFKQREHSAHKHVSNEVFTVAVPPARHIPLPEFYPTERTSTASFKAPVTSAGKKKMEVPPPPPPGTLTTAMSYISSPVKYISSMFSTVPPPAPEPVKIKERHFKIDLEREKEKEQSPKMASAAKTLQTAMVEEITPAKNPQAPEKNGSAWRRKNMMDYGVHLPTSPKPAPKFRALSPKRSTAGSHSNVEMSPTSFHQMTIAPSNQHSYKVMSRFQSEEPEKKKKKDPRKVTNTNLNKSKFNTPLPTKLNVTSAKDDFPIFPYPTVLPPRIPPATYSIRSNNTHKTLVQEEDTPAIKDVEPSLENEVEASVTSALSVDMTREEPEFVSCPSSTTLKTFSATGLNKPSDVGEEEQLVIEETLGKVTTNDMIKMSRLDQLPSGRINDARNLKNVFHDAKLVNDSQDNGPDNAVLPMSRIGAMNVYLCSSVTKYPSPTRVSVKNADSKTSPVRKSAAKRAASPREASTSPIRKTASPIANRSDGAVIISAKNQQRNQPQPGIVLKSNQPSGNSRSREIVSKSPKINSSSPQSHRRNSPLRVEDKHLAAVEESLGKIPGQRRSRLSSWNRSQGRDDTNSGVSVKPNVVIKTISRSKDRSPDKSTSSSALTTAAIATAAATAAAATAAITSATHPAQEEEKANKGPALTSTQGEHFTKQDNAPRSPPSSWKVGKEKGLTVSLSPSGTQVRKSDEEQLVQATADNAIDSSSKVYSKRSLSGSAKDFLKNKFVHAGKGKQTLSTQETSMKDADSEKKIEEEKEGSNCLEDYCGDPAKFFNAATMMGEIP